MLLHELPRCKSLGQSGGRMTGIEMCLKWAQDMFEVLRANDVWSVMQTMDESRQSWGISLGHSLVALFRTRGH